MIEPHPLKTTLALAATLAASVAFAQMTPTPKTSPETTGTVQVAPEGQGPVTSSSDPLVQKRIEDKAARDEYKARKAEAKAGYKGRNEGRQVCPQGREAGGQHQAQGGDGQARRAGADAKQWR